MRLGVRSDAVSGLGRAAHDVGLGALIGGNLFARVGMHPSLAEIGDERERGRVLNRSWQRYGPVNTLALGAVVAGWAGARLDEARPAMLSGRERDLALAKDEAVGALAVTGIASAVEGVRFARSEPEGAVPMESGDRAAADASQRSRTRKRVVNALGAAHLATAIGVAGINAALGQSNFRRPPARRLLRRRY
jgi:threonine dehydratase